MTIRYPRVETHPDLVAVVHPVVVVIQVRVDIAGADHQGIRDPDPVVVLDPEMYLVGPVYLYLIYENGIGGSGVREIRPLPPTLHYAPPVEHTVKIHSRIPYLRLEREAAVAGKSDIPSQFQARLNVLHVYEDLGTGRIRLVVISYDEIHPEGIVRLLHVRITDLLAESERSVAEVPGEVENTHVPGDVTGVGDEIHPGALRYLE